jgi:hypothetical protein
MTMPKYGTMHKPAHYEEEKRAPNVAAPRHDPSKAPRHQSRDPIDWEAEERKRKKEAHAPAVNVEADVPGRKYLKDSLRRYVRTTGGARIALQGGKKYGRS